MNVSDSGLDITITGIPQKSETARVPEVKPSSDTNIQGPNGAGSKSGGGMVSNSKPVPAPAPNIQAPNSAGSNTGGDLVSNSKPVPIPAPAPAPAAAAAAAIQEPNGAGSNPGGGLVSNSMPVPVPVPAAGPTPTPTPADEAQLGREAEKERPSKWIHFGPSHGPDTEVNQKAKDSAWQHIVNKSNGKESEYQRSIAKIEKEAKDSYGSSIMDELNRAPNKFVQMMVKDGCFFLQLALHILGAGKLLGYPPQHPYFGEDSESSSWIPAMFYVGNQIPYVVINSLMKQSFFKEVIRKGRWNHLRSEEDVAKLALYRTVVEPQLMIGPSEQRAEPPPFNVLEALHRLLLGSKHKNPISPEMRAFQDLEAGIEESKTKFPSAGELKKSGVTLKKAERGITTNIRFNNRIFYARLHVPPLTIDTHTKELLTSLVKLEQLVGEGDREVTAYLRFLRDLAPTYKDFKILQDAGIIHVTDVILMSTMVHVLHKLVFPNKSNLTHNFRNIKRRIEGYKGPPWALIGIIVSICTVVQAIIAIFAYGIPREAKRRS